jgi:dCMP deaminase
MQVEIPLYGDNFSAGVWQSLMHDAYRFAQRSPDPSTQNAAMLFNVSGLLIGHGINEFPEGVEYTNDRWERPLKYEVIEHAERNAIFMAAKHGLSTEQSTMVVPWAACSDCARAVIQAGVRRLVRHKQATDRGQGRNWDGTITTADMMLREAGVQVIDYDGSCGGDIVVRHSGEAWRP